MDNLQSEKTIRHHQNYLCFAVHFELERKIVGLRLYILPFKKLLSDLEIQYTYIILSVGKYFSLFQVTIFTTN